MPIVISIIPTLVGAAMLVGLNGSGQKGALLFGMTSTTILKSFRTKMFYKIPATYIVGFYGSSLAIIYAYNASNTSGHSKKVTVNAMTLAAFSLGNVIGTETFQPKDAPDFIPGKISILVLLSSQIFICFLLRFINLRLNKKKRKVIEELKARNGWTDEDVNRERERHAFLDLTDTQ